jgi:glycosyltransferase involved in cell wall biosynthesis
MAEWLPFTIQSCLEQEHRQIEIIVVDDGSTDSTKEVLESISGSIPLEYIKILHTGAPSRPRNIGFCHSSGSFIQFLDADDIILPKKLSRQVLQIQNSSTTSVAYCDYLFFSGNPPKNLRRFGPTHRAAWPRSFGEQFRQYTVHHRFLYPRTVLDKYGLYDETMTHAEDLDLWMRLLIHDVSFVYDSTPMALYRERHGVSMSNPVAQTQGILTALLNAEMTLRSRDRLANYLADIIELRDELTEQLTKLI